MINIKNLKKLKNIKIIFWWKENKNKWIYLILMYFILLFSIKSSKIIILKDLKHRKENKDVITSWLNHNSNLYDSHLISISVWLSINISYSFSLFIILFVQCHHDDNWIELMIRNRCFYLLFCFDCFKYYKNIIKCYLSHTYWNEI